MNEHDKTSNGDKVQMFVLGRGDNPQQQYSLPIHDFTDSSAYDDLRGSGDVTIQTLNLHSRIPIPGPHLVNEYLSTVLEDIKRVSSTIQSNMFIQLENP